MEIHSIPEKSASPPARFFHTSFFDTVTITYLFYILPGGVRMGIKLSDLEEGSRIMLNLRYQDNVMQLDAFIKKHLKPNIALITIDYPTNKRLVFDNVQVDMECCHESDIPFIWHGVKIVNYQSQYLMQVTSEGIKHNRRGFFRVGISIPARIRINKKGIHQIMIKDLSLSGFAIADRKKEINMVIGDELSLHFEDMGHVLDLAGRVVRIEEREDMTVYGLVIRNVCKDLSSYLSVKQRRKR